jgi:hypothetical protein
MTGDLWIVTENFTALYINEKKKFHTLNENDVCIFLRYRIDAIYVASHKGVGYVHKGRIKKL